MIIVEWMKRYRARRRTINACLDEVMRHVSAAHVENALMLRRSLAQRGIALNLDACLVETEFWLRRKRKQVRRHRQAVRR